MSRTKRARSGKKLVDLLGDGGGEEDQFVDQDQEAHEQPRNQNTFEEDEIKDAEDETEADSQKDPANASSSDRTVAAARVENAVVPYEGGEAESKPPTGVVPAGPILITSRKLYLQHWKDAVAKDIQKAPGKFRESYSMIMRDTEDNKIRCWRLVPVDAIDFYDSSFLAAAGNNIPQISVRCKQLQPSHETLQVLLPPCRAYFSKLAPLGNYHPQGLKWQKKSLLDAESSILLSFSDSRDDPEFNDDLLDAREWIEQLETKGIEFSMFSPSSKPYQMLTGRGNNQEQEQKETQNDNNNNKKQKTGPPAKGNHAFVKTFNPEGSAEEVQEYRDAFMTHVRSLWKNDEGSTYSDPYRLKARKRLMSTCTVDEVKQFAVRPYVIPGGLEVIEQVYKKCLPPKDPKTGIQQRKIVQDVPIFNRDGTLIPMSKREEIKAYTDVDQTDFIDASKRQTIQNGEWVIPEVRFVFTYFPGDKEGGAWNFGMKVEIVSIQRFRQRSEREKRVAIYDEENMDPKLLPTVPAIPGSFEGGGDTDQTDRIKEILAKLTRDQDKELLAFDMDSVVSAATVTAAATTSAVSAN
jgi:hypothetical protein